MRIKTILTIFLVFLLLICSGCTEDNASETQSPSLDYESDYESEAGFDESQYIIETDYNDLLQYVDSSCFESVGYDENGEVLYVRFLDSGSVYAYYNVPYYEYDELIYADSIGGYYNSFIKGQYDCERLE